MSFDWPEEVVLEVKPTALTALVKQAPPRKSKHNAPLMERFIARLDRAAPEALETWTLGRHEHRYLARLTSESEPDTARRDKLVRLCVMHIAALRPALQASCLAHLIDEHAVRSAAASMLADSAPTQGPRWFQAHATSQLASSDPVAYLTRVARETGLGPSALLNTWELDPASTLGHSIVTKLLEGADEDFLTRHRTDLLSLVQNRDAHRGLRFRVLVALFESMSAVVGQWTPETSAWLTAASALMGGMPAHAAAQWGHLPPKAVELGRHFERDQSIYHFFKRHDRNAERRDYWRRRAQWVSHIRVFPRPVDACAMRLGAKYYVEFRQRDRIDGNYDGRSSTCYAYTPEEWRDLLSRPIKRPRDLQRRGLWGFPHRDRIARRSSRWQPLFDAHIKKTLNR